MKPLKAIGTLIATIFYSIVGFASYLLGFVLYVLVCLGALYILLMLVILALKVL